MTTLRITVLMIVLTLTMGVGAQDVEVTSTPGPVIGRQGMAGQNQTPAALDALDPNDAVNEDGSCRYEWFFDTPEPESCPLAQSLAGNATFQRFEFGYMLWTEPTDMIYVMHSTVGDPAWLAAPDPYVAGAPERDPDWNEPRPELATQPRLGFGELWRSDEALRRRIGWAAQEWEIVYQGQMQTAVDGTIYIQEPSGGIFALPPESDWMLYSGR